ncbi:Protein STR-48 [Aphelenchoides avenae]|nr:Protein STR-48 [Aphelenchus avenae]
MKVYKQILLVTCVGDLLLSTIVLFGQPCIIFDSEYVLFVSNGFVSRRYELLDRVAMAAFCGGLHTNIVVVALQFLWRYQWLTRDERSVRTSGLFVVVSWCLAQAATAYWCFVRTNYPDEHAIGIATLRKHGWTIDKALSPFPSVTGLGSLEWGLHNVFYATSVFVAYAVIIWCQRQSMRYLKKYSSSSRESTQRAHAEFNRALVVLALTPLVSLVPTIFMVGCTVLRIDMGQVTMFLTIAMTSITLLNPIATILLVRPYRLVVIQTFKVKTNTVAVLSSIEMSDAQNQR